MQPSTVYISCKQCLFLKNKNQVEVHLPLESLLLYSVYRYNDPALTKLYVVNETELLNSTHFFQVSLTLTDNVDIITYSSLPWEVAACMFPVAQTGDTVITGLCAVARLICKHRYLNNLPPEHEEGLLGFRKSCLQAPNEASIWTKFCEVDIVNTIYQLMNIVEPTIPENIYRFENHLKKPVKIHNIYKVAQQVNNESAMSTNAPNERSLISSVENMSIDKRSNERPGKNRKWKSSVKKNLLSTNIPMEDLNLIHTFAEGPFMTLADLILYPCFYIVRRIYGDTIMNLHLSHIVRWLDELENIEHLQPVKVLMKGVELLNFKNIKAGCPSSVKTPTITDVSLYKHDPKRHNPRKRIFTKENNVESALNTVQTNYEFCGDLNEILKPINWSNIPDGANPNSGHLPDKRSARKSQQLENLALAVMKISKEGDIIVDFCSGSGHLGILLAYLLPKCTIILLENKEQSLLRARKRVHNMMLKNVYFYQCNLDFFIGKFDIGVALHACGIASDLVLDKCLKCNAKFVICPCCYGSLHQTDRLNYPRSSAFSNVSVEDYICIGHAADQTHTDHPLEKRGARCMGVIDSDRGRLAEELGYNVTLLRLNPLSCTPKNNLLVGLPKE